MIQKKYIKKNNQNQSNTKNSADDQQESSKIKQDINFLDKPLWFQNATSENRVWTDIDGYEYRTGYKVPEKIDIIILLYLLIKTQKLHYQKKLSLSRYEILKGCDLLQNHPAYYYNRLEDSLKRLKNISIEFQGTFYDGNKYVSMGFGIIDDYKINTEIKRVEINFNENWLLKVKESAFLKSLNFEYYKALKRPVSRRLFEILCKTFKEGNKWSIHLNQLGAQLTLQGRKRKNRNGPYEIIYASDVLVAIKPAINELNQLAMTPDIAKKLNINDIFTLQYKITGNKQDRIIHFTKVPIPSSTTATLKG